MSAGVYSEPTPTATVLIAPAAESPIYRDTLVDARHYSTDFLLEREEVYALDAADDDPHFPGPIGRYGASERLRAVQAELSRRSRIIRRNPDLTIYEKRATAWAELARLVKDQVDIVEVFVRSGYQLHDTSPTGAHAACLACGGTDRLVIWRDPPGRCWCRKCDWSGDLITVTMSLQRCGFRDAVTWLADLVGAGQVPQ